MFDALEFLGFLGAFSDRCLFMENFAHGIVQISSDASVLHRYWNPIGAVKGQDQLSRPAPAQCFSKEICFLSRVRLYVQAKNCRESRTLVDSTVLDLYVCLYIQT